MNKSLALLLLCALLLGLAPAGPAAAASAAGTGSLDLGYDQAEHLFTIPLRPSRGASC